MKEEKNIFTAFILNLIFSVFEFFGGIYTGSVAVISDSVHDLGDALSIGLSYFLEKKSRKQPDEKYTYGYLRYSLLGGLITTLILIQGSVIVIINAGLRLVYPKEINYEGMIIFAVIGLIVNAAGAFVTHGGSSLNQRAVNLHMLEDVSGWAVVLIGAVIMKFTKITVLDPLMSIGVAVFILYNSIKSFKKIIEVFLEKTPHNLECENIRKEILEINGVINVHHMHIWSMDGVNNYATMHIVTSNDFKVIKKEVKEKLYQYDIHHATLELEDENEECLSKECKTKDNKCSHCHHHH